jgi:hypothetical protein
MSKAHDEEKSPFELFAKDIGDDKYSLKIEKIETKKSQIFQRKHMVDNIIPNFPSIGILTGPAGSGKTTLLINLLTKPQFYGLSYEGVKVPTVKDIRKGKAKKAVEPKMYFDHIILLMGSADDMYDDLIKDGIIDQVIHNPTSADIQNIITTQEELLAENDGNILKVPKLLIIGEDLMSNQRLLNSKPFADLSIKNRHLNATIWYMSQYINLVPKRIREQASHIFIFQCTAQCVKVLTEQFRDMHTSKLEFENMLAHATTIGENGERNFLYINKRSPHKFRKNLDTHLYFPWQEEPETINRNKSQVKKHFKEAIKASVVLNEDGSVDDTPMAEFPNVNEPQHLNGKVIHNKEPEKVLKTYIIRGRRINFTI